MSIRLAVLALIAAVLAGCSPDADTGEDAVTVLAAASLTDALTAVGEAWQAETGGAVRFSFAASSPLARQIEAGAPADIFVSADTQWMDYLSERGLIEDSSRALPIGNALALIAPADSPLRAITIDPSLDLAGLLFPDRRLAAGDPDHVPAGIYAKEALEALGLWDEASPRLARAEDVRAALALVARGEAPLGIVYATDAAIDSRVKIVGLFPPESHDPIVYPFAMLAGRHSRDAHEFFAYATGPEAAAIYERFGFTVR